MQKIRNKKKRVDLSNIIYFLCGFIVFSPISSYLSQSILNLPLALPEIFFIPFYFSLKKRINLKPNYRILSTGSFFLIFLIAIALLVGLFPFSSILSTARGYFYMILVFSIFKNKQIPNIDIVFYITFGATLAWMMFSLMSFNQILSNLSDGQSLAVYGNMIALGLFVSVSVLYKDKFLVFLGFIVVLIISITAGLRRQMLVAITSYILSILLLFNFTFKRVFKIAVAIALVSIFLINTFPIADSYIEKVSPTLHMRMFKKTELLITGDVSISDQTRLNSFDSFVNNLEDYVLPRGLVSKRTMQDEGTGLFMDSPYVEILHTFGLIFTIPILIYLFSCIIFHFKNYYQNKVKESSLWVVMGCVVIVLLLIEGSFLNFTYATPITGFVFARLASRKNLNL